MPVSRPVLSICLALLALGGCALAPERERLASPGETASAPLVTATGRFEGRGGHVATGTGEIARVGKDWVIILGEDFRLDDAAGAVVALGNQGSHAAAPVAPLARAAGRQVIPIPKSIDVGGFFEIWIWSEGAGAPIAVAPLRLT